MTIKVGDRLPDVPLAIATPEGPQPTTTTEHFKGKKIALFAVPGAYTPTCSARHLPGYVDKAGDFTSKGVDEIACTSVNDAFVMDAWGKSQNSGEILMLADGNAEFTKLLGLELDASKFGMGVRAQRFALVAKDGVVEHLFIEAPGEFKVSAADHVLAQLS